jgi:hypothetical protein
VDHLLLQRPVETLGYTIGLWLGDEGGARRNTPELDRVEEIIGGVLRAVVHAQNQPASGIGAGGAKLCLETLGDRLQGREAVADLDRMDANAKGIVVIDRRVHPYPTVFDGLNCGTARRVWNWALNEWNKQYAVGFGVFRSQLEYKARDAEPETAGNRNCPTRGESDQ